MKASSICLFLALSVSLQVSNVAAQAQQALAVSNSQSHSSTVSATTQAVGAGSISSLSNASGKSLILDFSNSAVLNLSGDFSNSGTIYAISSNPKINSATINAANIFNNANGLITSILPAGGLPGFSNAISNLSLTFNATHNFVNSGAVMSSANLSVNAGGSIINASNIAGVNPVMQAVNNINLYSGAGSIVNSGNISATAGNINISSLAGQNIIINNLGGMMQAALGQINVRDLAFTGKDNLALLGGNLIARDINLYSGTGIVALDVKDIQGVLNIVAGEAHVTAQTEKLQLGNIALSGDPTFYNTAGDVLIDTDLVFPGMPLAIVASGNILSKSGAGKIDTSSSTGNGGNILLVAGALFTSSDGGSTTDPFKPQLLTILGGNPLGGKIDLNSTPITLLSSASTKAGGSGGNIQLIAYSSTAPQTNNKVITLPDALTIRTGGTGSGKNGDVLLMASNRQGDTLPFGTWTIKSGNIDTTGGSGGGGNISVYASPVQAASTGACSTCAYIQNAELINASVFNRKTTSTSNPTPITYGNIKTGTLSASGQNISAISSADLLLGTINNDALGANSGGTVTLKANPNLLIGTPTASGVNGSISSRGGVLGGKGGTVSITSSGVTLNSLSNINVNPYQGDGGKIDLATNFTRAPGGTMAVDASGGNFNGGSFSSGPITITDGQHLTITANASGSGNGGSIKLTSNGDLGSAANQISLQAAGGSVGSSAGDGGSITVVNQAATTIEGTALDVNPRGLNGKGGSITLNSSFSDFHITGSLIADGVGTGDGGTVTLTNGSSQPFIVGAASGGATTNGVDNIVSAKAGAVGGSGGIISISSNADLQVGSDPLINSAPSLLVRSTSGNGGQLLLKSTTGSISVSRDLNTDGTGANGNGGVISLTAAGSGSLSRIFSANASGTGNGGNVKIDIASNGFINFASNGTRIFAQGGSTGSATGNGGTVYVKADFLTLNQSFLKADPRGTNGKGASITFVTKFFTHPNSIHADGVGNGSGGNIEISGLQSNFVIGTGGSGINGFLTANAGPLGGSGGAVKVQSFMDLTLLSSNAIQAAGFNNTLPSGDGGSVSLSANGQLSIPTGTYNFDGNTNGGKISFVASLYNVGTGVNLSAKGQSNGGNVAISSGFSTTAVGPGLVSINASGGNGGVDGNGGKISITGNNLIVDTSAIDVSPHGPNGKGGTINLTGVATAKINGNLNAAGVGSGSGGEVYIIAGFSGTPADSSIGPGSVYGVNGNISVDAGATGAKGGSITLDFAKSNLNILSWSAVSAKAAHGDGGNLSVFTSGNLSVPSGQFSINAGAGDHAGGTIALVGSSPNGGSAPSNTFSINGGGPLLLETNGSGTGSGGSIQIGGKGVIPPLASFNLHSQGGAKNGNGGTVTYGVSNGDLVGTLGNNISVAPGGNGKSGTLNLSATRDILLTGDISSLGGSAYGGTLTLTAGRDLVFTGNVNLTPTANGNGGTLNLTGARNVILNGSASVSGSGTGNGGAINIKYASSANPNPGPFVVGSTILSSGVTGSLAANAPGSGSGGTITITNNSVFGTPAAGQQNLKVDSSISAKSSTGQMGNIILPGTGSSVVTGAGTISGALNLPSGSASTINLSNPSGTLTLASGVLPSNITVAKLNIPAGTSLIGGSSVINAGNVVNNGLIFVDSRAGNSLTIQNAAGLSVTGTGTLQAPSLVFNSSARSVFVTQGNLIGPVTGKAAGTFFVTTTNKALSTNAALLNAASSGTVVTIAGTIPDINTGNLGGTSSSVLATDSTPRHVSLGEASDDEGVVKLGDKYVVTSTNQNLSLFAVGDNSVEFAEEGTELTADEGKVYLRKGKMVVATSNQGKSIKTPQGNVELGPNSSAVVKVSVVGTVKVTALNGEGKLVSRTFNTTPEKSESVTSFKAGEELVSNDDGLDDEELIPTDGIERGEAIIAGITKTGRTTVKRSISLNQVISKDIMINGSLIHVKGASRKLHREYAEGVRQQAAAQQFKPYRNIAYVQSVPVPKLNNVSPKASSGSVLFPSKDAQYDQISSNYIKLDGGALFLHAQENTVVKTHYCVLSIEKGACVNLLAGPTTVCIRVCSGMRPVKVFVGKTMARLAVGEELLLSKKTMTVDEVYSADNVSHRDCRVSRFKGLAYAHSEFSIPSLLSNSSHLRGLVFAKTAEAKIARAKVMKSAVCMQMVRGYKGPFTQHALK